MKKILLLIAGISFGMNSMAQDAEGKEVQAGLVFGTSILMQNVTSDYFQKGKVSSDLSIGMNVNFSLTESLVFCTGVEFDFETLNYESKSNKGLFYVYEGKNIIQQSDVDVLNTNQNVYQMDSRIQKATYLTIPTMLQFRTNFIGYFRYFGKFGLRNSFLVKSTINDIGGTVDPLFLPLDPLFLPLIVIGKDAREDMRAKNDLFFMKSAVGMSLGAEWNFVGTTCLVAELGYYYGFTPLHTQWNTDKQKNYHFTYNSAGDKVEVNNAAQQSQLQFKLSILF
jgi:hypothetical protein